jgi:succinyl-diaminopimelate desuccinylase
MDYAKLDQIVESLREPLIQTLQKWVRVNSVKGEPAPNAPFGPAVRKMLDMALNDCRDLGFEVRDIDGYAGDAQMGQGDDVLGILAHLDIVPAGDGWKTDPFGADLIDGRIYGRGTSDDKGPAVAALYAMKAVQMAGIQLKKRVRLILGCDEESGMDDMKYYQAHADMPDTGFSPDACFPVINTEKGLYHLKLSGPSAKDGLKILNIEAGQRPNVIPGLAQAYVAGDAGTVSRVEEFAKTAGFPVTAECLPDGRVKISAQGVAGHAAMPEMAKNAILRLLKVLEYLGVQGPLLRLAQVIGLEYDGTSLNIAVSDKLSGALTLNLGILRADEQNVEATIDIRYPVMASPEAILKSIAAAVQPAGLAVSESAFKKPHHVPESSVLVQSLLDAYHEVTGRPRQAIAIGGGTYARCLKEGVAFGSLFPEDEELAHQAGEYMTIDGLMANVKIFIRAIVKLAAE